MSLHKLIMPFKGWAVIMAIALGIVGIQFVVSCAQNAPSEEVATEAVVEAPAEVSE